MDKIKFFYLSLVLILGNTLTPNISFSKEELFNLSSTCKNYEMTKDKLAAVLRAYQCEKSETFEQCQTSLNLGPYAAAGLTSTLALKGVKSIQGQFRNKNYVRCSVTKLPLLHLNNFNVINIWPYFVNSTYASKFCYDPITTFVDNLRLELITNNDELNKRLTQLQKSIPDSVKVDDPQNSKKKLIPTRAELEKAIPDYKIELEKFANIESQIANSSSVLDDKLNQFKSDYPKAIIRINEIRDRNITNRSDLASMLREYSRYKANSPISPDELNKIEKLIRSEGLAKADFADLKTSLGTDKYDKLRSFNAVTEIEKIKPKLDQIKVIQREFNSYFTKSKIDSPYNAREFDFLLKQIYDSGAITEDFKSRLDYYTSYLNSNFQELNLSNSLPGSVTNKMARNPVERLNYERTTNQASYYRESLRRKAIKAIPVIGGGLTLAGPVLSAEIFDPAALTPLGESSNAGDCSIDYSSIIPRDPNNNCAYKTELNTDLYKKFSEADDSELEDLFQDKGVCNLIQTNYFKFYPKLNSQNVRCEVNKPVTLKYEDGLQLAVDSNAITITKKAKGLEDRGPSSKVTFQLDPNNKKPFKYSNLNISNESDLSKFKRDAKPLYEKFSLMRHIAAEVMACCQMPGGGDVIPGIEDCNRYGININDSSMDNQIQSK